MPTVKTTPPPSIWHSCYEESWKGVISDAAFSHPAKFSMSLIHRIVDHGIQSGWWKQGDLIGDCFGGVGLGGVACTYRGMRWVGVELEARFVRLGRQNFRRHRSKWRDMGYALPVIIKGDSRQFDKFVADAKAVICSPPYAGISTGAGGLNTKPAKHAGQQSGRQASAASQDTDQKYGETPGQISRLKEGNVDGVITSPPFLAARSDTTKSQPGKTGPVKERHETTQAGAGYGDTKGQIDHLKAGTVDAVIASPPFADSITCQDPNMRDGRTGGGGTLHGDYGDSKGQIGKMKAGDVDGVICSPPFTQTEGGAKGINVEGYNKGHQAPEYLGKRTYQGRGGDRAKNNIEVLPAGELDAIVTSPPFTQGYSSGGGINKNGYEGKGAKDENLGKRTYQGTGADRSPQNIEVLGAGELDAAITSPPYENSIHGRNGADVTKLKRKVGKNSQVGAQGYGDTEGQIGEMKKETYWQAMHAVYLACHRAIRPGGYIAVVVKDYVKKKARVRLCDDTVKLLEHCGFELVERVHAMLVKENRHAGLFGEDVVETTERKSFFRRLAESKGSPPIDYEEVIICRRP